MITIDLILLVHDLLAPQLRGPNMLAFLNAALKPARTQLSAFYAFFDAVEYELTFTGQVIYLEHVLNNEFDPTLRRIYITDSDQLNDTYLFNVVEGNETTYAFNASESADPLYLTNQSETVAQADFAVNVPIGLVYDLPSMLFYINKYRIAPKRFIINEV